MVYCSKCGTQNPENVTNCSNCVAPLYTVGQKYLGSEQEQYRQVVSVCFGPPVWGMIISLVFGTIIILAGLGLFLQQTTYRISLDIWPMILVIFGVPLLIGALYKHRRQSVSS